MRILTVAIYAIGALIVTLSGSLYPSLKTWSHWADGVCGFYCLLTLVIGGMGVVPAARIAARFWFGLSTPLTAGLLLAFALGHQRLYIVGAAGLLGIAAVVTLAFALLLRSNQPPLKI